MKGKYAYLNAKSASDLDISAALFKQAFEEQPNYITARNYYANILFRLRVISSIDKFSSNLIGLSICKLNLIFSYLSI